MIMWAGRYADGVLPNGHWWDVDPADRGCQCDAYCEEMWEDDDEMYAHAQEYAHAKAWLILSLLCSCKPDFKAGCRTLIQDRITL